MRHRSPSPPTTPKFTVLRAYLLRFVERQARIVGEVEMLVQIGQWRQRAQVEILRQRLRLRPVSVSARLQHRHQLLTLTYICKYKVFISSLKYDGELLLVT